MIKTHRVYSELVPHMLPKKNVWVSPHFKTAHAREREVRYKQIPNTILVQPSDIKEVEYVKDYDKNEVEIKKYLIVKKYNRWTFKLVVSAKDFKVITFYPEFRSVPVK